MAEVEKVVRYVGFADVREITAAQWKGAGVEGQAKTVWDASNQRSVKLSELSDKALEILRADPGFEFPKA